MPKNPPSNRLLFIVTQAQWGGVQSYVVRAAKEAIARGCEVCVAAGGEGELEARCRSFGLPYKRLSHMNRTLSPINDVMALWELTTLIRAWRPSVVYLHSSKAGVLGSVAARIAGVKRVVYRIGGWSFLDPVSPMQKALRRWSERLTVSLKDVVITVNPGDERLANEMKLRARQEIVTVPNALNLDHFDASLRSKDEARRILNGLRHAAGDEDGSPQARIVLTVANFYAYKNLVGYLDAVKVVQDRLKGVRFIILGGEGEEWASFLPKRRALGLDSVVASPGPYADAWTLLRGADLFVLPSVKEGMPWTILETMAAGVPCVVTDVGANRWMLAEAGTIVPPGDAKALAEAIVTRLADPVGSASLGRRGREIVEARFTEGAMWDATFRLLGVAHQVDPVGSGR